jgi:hypothetical protein
LVVAPKGDKKCKVNAALLKTTFNSYGLNKQQDKSNIINFSDEKARKKMSTAAVRLMWILENYFR